MASNQYVNKVQYGNSTLIDLTSDTVTADKLALGYTAHDASGAPITGTMSGGGGTGGVTQDQDGYIVLPETGGGGGGGGGSSNVVYGMFTTNASEGAQTVSIPYSGSGHPIAALVFIDTDIITDAMYVVNNWFVSFLVVKKSITIAPTYDGNTSNNSCRAQCVYINGRTSNAGGNVNNAYSAAGADATASAVLGLRFTSDTTLSAYVRGDSYGFFPSTEYQYVVAYSE